MELESRVWYEGGFFSGYLTFSLACTNLVKIEFFYQNIV